MVGAVEVDEDMMLGSFLSNTLIEVYHPLILTVHEVDFCAFDAPFLKLLEEIHVVFDCEPRQP